MQTYVFRRPTLPLVVLLIVHLYGKQFLELQLAGLRTQERATWELIYFVFEGIRDSIPKWSLLAVPNVCIVADSDRVANRNLSDQSLTGSFGPGCVFGCYHFWLIPLHC